MEVTDWFFSQTRQLVRIQCQFLVHVLQFGNRRSVTNTLLSRIRCRGGLFREEWLFRMTNQCANWRDSIHTHNVFHFNLQPHIRLDISLTNSRAQPLSQLSGFIMQVFGVSRVFQEYQFLNCWILRHRSRTYRIFIIDFIIGTRMGFLLLNSGSLKKKAIGVGSEERTDVS